ncbi:uncharacterized protein EV422DRAFT_510852 [Fimicolochytrium jonesii]|uniref:uncharacterized protein n=1 Tax=Fimicolochytrium jonesii TaxID=1396493 RepID=UPI0022FEB9B5|nr:uncharacterized protein EV422DRAFT_510852 [Fimicolochytrium jonesii]KAI8826610.1 hypothetical protein EV422DRAFT_510852 [Fimicolochytrium jonesii]
MSGKHEFRSQLAQSTQRRQDQSRESGNDQVNNGSRRYARQSWHGEQEAQEGWDDYDAYPDRRKSEGYGVLPPPRPRYLDPPVSEIHPDPALEADIQSLMAMPAFRKGVQEIKDGVVGFTSTNPTLEEGRIDIQNPSAYLNFFDEYPGEIHQSLLVDQDSRTRRWVGGVWSEELKGDRAAFETYTTLRARQEQVYAIATVKQGIESFLQLDFDRALRKFETALSHDPDCVEAYVARGALYAKQEKYKSAVSDFKSALELDPSHSNANTYLRMTQRKVAEIEREKESAAAGEFLMPLDYDPKRESLSAVSDPSFRGRTSYAATASSSAQGVGNGADPDYGSRKRAKSGDVDSERKKKKKEKKKKSKKQRWSDSSSGPE